MRTDGADTLFECEKLAEPLWRMLSEIIIADLSRRGVQRNITVFAYNVITTWILQGWRKPTAQRFISTGT